MLLTLLASPENLIIQNTMQKTAQKRSKERDRGWPQLFQEQKQEYAGKSYIGKRELIDQIVTANSMASAVNQNRLKNEQCITGSS